MLIPRTYRWIALMLALCLLVSCGEGQASAPALTDTNSASAATDSPTPDPEPRPISDSAPLASAPPEASYEEPAQPQTTANLIILNPPPTGADPLVQRLRQVLTLDQTITVVQAGDPRQIRIEITPVKDLRALANKIPFGKIERIDDRTNTITVDYEM